MEKKLDDYLAQLEMYCELIKEVKKKGRQGELLRSLDERFLDIESEYLHLMRQLDKKIREKESVKLF